ncbi:hypothetical protein [Methanomethylovorans sp. PtaU1.Bin093]|nr:hypothetical protein [Methanomethylovorans sp. PtaU1.Bin093]
MGGSPFSITDNNSGGSADLNRTKGNALVMNVAMATTAITAII